MDIEELYKRYRRALFSYAYRLTRHREIAEDLTEDAFLEAMKCQKSVNLAWLKKVVYHLYTKQRDNTDALTDAVSTENLADVIEREDEARKTNGAMTRRITRLMTKLTPEERRIIKMIAKGRTQKETGKELHCTQPNISKRLKSIRKKL